MSEQQSIRDQLAQVIAVGDGARGHMVLADDELVADQIMASPVIRRIQAEVLRDAARMIESLSSSDSPAARLDMYAGAIEKGDDA